MTWRQITSEGVWWGVWDSTAVGEPGITNWRSWVPRGAESAQAAETDNARTADRPPHQQASGSV